MSSSLPDDLTQAVALLRARRLGEARALLTDSLRREPRSDHAWFLLSLAVEDPRQQRDCLERALQLNSKHVHARERLAELDEEPSAPPASSAAPPADPPVQVSAPPATPAAPAPAPPAPMAPPTPRQVKPAPQPPPKPIQPVPIQTPPQPAAAKLPIYERRAVTLAAGA